LQLVRGILLRPSFPQRLPRGQGFWIDAKSFAAVAFDDHPLPKPKYFHETRAIAFCAVRHLVPQKLYSGIYNAI
jgi:hypothetical protein